MSRDMNHTTTNSARLTETLVLVADARSARLVLRETSGGLKEIWKLYAADDRVRGLGQSPDTREVMAQPATPESIVLARKAFAAQIADRLREIPNVQSAGAIVVIAPQSFGEALHDGFGARLWARVKHNVPRDEVDLSDFALQRVVDQALASSP
jgi:hypothetical protein